MATTPDKDLSDRLRASREQAGLSQSQVAKLLGYLRPTISEIEAGRRKVTAEELGKFADIYGVTTEWLLGRPAPKDSMPPSLLLAARELGKLQKADLDKVIDFLKTVKNHNHK